MLTVIVERVCRALDKNGETRPVALVNSKAFDRISNADVSLTFKGYGNY